MSQRNPMNDRYQTDERLGQTRKSAASAKPKAKAAASVRVQPAQKTPQQKKAAKKVERSKQTTMDRKYYNPPTAEYKKLRKIWWGLLIGAIVTTAFSWIGRAWFPEEVTYVMLGGAYICIIGALYIDFAKIRKVRRAYQAEMESTKTKEQRAIEKQQKSETQKQTGEQPKGDDSADATPKKAGLFGTGFRLPKVGAAKAEKPGAEGNTEAATGADSKDSSK